ncbi:MULTISPECIES: DUF3304 domain-containing protein [Enterobacter cloacae complex]|uniref:DUF3304 domain-containing protein n=1 Tax=Enterobacter cloacae complex TaxID=354276 RepID=UPI00097C5822|nr:DUF3304 domain-containing protein [Enterobacter chengduensis]GJL42775.1 hypothetical protein TUM17577_39840 [Enterobacter asburiae]MBT1935483.1 DUF3304 domain-containing protein [Enterobacter chengduensis]MBT1963933.1 DUF3304 domain-containing protein [Enterobacter chengduensis]MCK6820251.1 DUF3304 domain-containing protein [Enterobacter chengduensis]MCK7170822.1 DUF3304 domain-containing protein [Enterobacter chengduensis]
MGLFKTFGNVDNAVNRGYARWGKWIWGSLLAIILAYGGWLIWASIWGPPTGPVTLIIHSEIDRPILGFSVNGVAGANSAAHNKNNPYASGPGKSTCCGSISGKTAEVIWTLSTTRAQYDAGLRKETRRVVMPLPERKWEENYLHVYFFPDDKIRLWWGTGFISPKADAILINPNARE